MLDSIFIGITGVRSHQTRLNVISNNVANINTTAYKAARANFSDVMSKTLKAGSGDRGQTAATNPLQSGLGVQVSSIDTVQRQGTLQSTGIDTDLAIEGDGFFILKEGPRQLYTRDGTFSIDPTGKFFDPGSGLVVQGNLANADGSFKSELEDLIVPLDRESEARATSQIHLSGNLDASGSGTGAPVWSSTTSFGKPARLTSTNFALDFTTLNTAGLKVKIEEGGVVSESTLNLPIKTFADRVELVSELNSLINANGTLKGKVLFKTGVLEDLVLRTVEGGDKISLTVDNAKPDLTGNIIGLLGFAATEQFGQAADNTDKLNDLANVGKDLSEGDVLRFSGVKDNGERFDGRFTVASAEDDTLDDLLKVVESVYGGVRAGLDPNTGKLLLNDNVTGGNVVGFDINFSLLDDGATAITTSGLFGDQPPFEFSTNTQVFDEKGDTHSLTVNFTKSVVANQWNWVATVDGITPDTGNNGKALFNEDGTLRSFEAADKAAIAFVPDGGTSPLNIEILATDTERLGGLTQFVSPSSVSVREQDGRTAGSLVSISVESTGGIVGLFSNGNSEALGRVSLSSFSNAGGLSREGNNLFAQTEASGQPVTGTAESTIQSSIRSGAIELSNVDLAQEFTNMIVTQRGFQASARSITTSDELLSELVNLKR